MNKSIQGSVKSKTMWVSIAISVSGAITANAPHIQNLISPAMFGWLMFGAGIVFAVLRAVTSKSLADK